MIEFISDNRKFVLFYIGYFISAAIIFRDLWRAKCGGMIAFFPVTIIGGLLAYYGTTIYFCIGGLFSGILTISMLLLPYQKDKKKEYLEIATFSVRFFLFWTPIIYCLFLPKLVEQALEEINNRRD